MYMVAYAKTAFKIPKRKGHNPQQIQRDGVSNGIPCMSSSDIEMENYTLPLAIVMAAE